jgi:predicted transcriptional regulator
MTKLQLFEKELQEMATIYKVLSHPARLAILKYLSETKTCISGNISNELPLSRTTVHQHLTELKKINIIQGEIEGVKTNYCLNPKIVKQIKEKVIGFLDEIDIEDMMC